ncbi:hypothetical protein MTO96_018980 [Rhipicephalus appendiculatus]
MSIYFTVTSIHPLHNNSLNGPANVNYWLQGTTERSIPSHCRQSTVHLIKQGNAFTKGVRYSALCPLDWNGATLTQQQNQPDHSSCFCTCLHCCTAGKSLVRKSRTQLHMLRLREIFRSNIMSCLLTSVKFRRHVVALDTSV